MVSQEFTLSILHILNTSSIIKFMLVMCNIRESWPIKLEKYLLNKFSPLKYIFIIVLPFHHFLESPAEPGHYLH